MSKVFGLCVVWLEIQFLELRAGLTHMLSFWTRKGGVWLGVAFMTGTNECLKLQKALPLKPSFRCANFWFHTPKGATIAWPAYWGSFISSHCCFFHSSYANTHAFPLCISSLHYVFIYRSSHNFSLVRGFIVIFYISVASTEYLCRLREWMTIQS